MVGVTLNSRNNKYFIRFTIKLAKNSTGALVVAIDRALVDPHSILEHQLRKCEPGRTVYITDYNMLYSVVALVYSRTRGLTAL